MTRFAPFILLVFAVLVGALSQPGPGFATGAFETAGNSRWLVFASRQNVDEAIGLARRFGSEFGPPKVMSSTNGWYAVVAGPLSIPNAEALKKRLANVWWAPKDTFASNGRTFVDRVWEASKSPVLATASSDRGSRVASVAGLEVRVVSDDAVSVRNNGEAVASLKFDDQGPAVSTDAEIAWLDRSSPFPQVVVRNFTGGAHCCTLLKVLTFVDGRWRTLDAGEFAFRGASDRRP